MVCSGNKQKEFNAPSDAF